MCIKEKPSNAILANPFRTWLECICGCNTHGIKKSRFFTKTGKKKAKITEKNRLLRLAWAIEHLDWTEEQWREILWSDETWVNNSHHRRTWVTRRKGEEYDPTCVIFSSPGNKAPGWMFWACFNGTEKGPCVFWEKEWGSINKESFCEHIVPIIEGWIRLHPELQFMQDHAPGHRAKATKEEMEARGIKVIDWPPYSPDLNPIEAVWDLMKDWIQEYYGDEDKLSYDTLRKAVKEAWDAVTVEQLHDLIKSMRARCQAVIDANGMQTKF